LCCCCLQYSCVAKHRKDPLSKLSKIYLNIGFYILYLVSCGFSLYILARTIQYWNDLSFSVLYYNRWFVWNDTFFFVWFCLYIPCLWCGTCAGDGHSNSAGDAPNEVTPYVSANF
jgi:hypothetical protein